MFQTISKWFNNVIINSNRYHLLTTYWVPNTLYAFMSMYMSATRHKLLSHTFSQQFYNNSHVGGNHSSIFLLHLQASFYRQGNWSAEEVQGLNQGHTNSNTRPWVPLVCSIWLQSPSRSKLSVFCWPMQIQFLSYLQSHLSAITRHWTIPTHSPTGSYS